MKKLLASDYDQTYYLNDLDIVKNIEETKKWIDKGNIFVIATGRSYQDLKNKQDKYNFVFDYVILNHGATIIDKNNIILWNKIIPNKIISKIKDNLDKSNYISYFCCSTLESRVDFNHSNLTKIAVTYDNKEKALRKAEELNNSFKNDIKAFYVNNNSVEILAKLAGKEKAIQYLSKRNHIKKDKIYTIGDGYSDINMIKVFQGYAMEQGVEELKTNAKKVYNSVSLLIKDLLNKDE